jgi:cytidine deaminase
VTELSAGDEQLIRVASLARQRAYAPYSRYRVGAAIRTKRNKIHSGANVENASYGLAICAERAAVFAAVAAGDKEYEAVAVVAEGDELPSPCGACRQVISEFAPNARVILGTTGGLRGATTMRDLLPDAFGPGRLPS